VRPAFSRLEHGLFERDLIRTRLGRMREQRDDLARMTQDLAKQASDDPLTGLANRRALDLHIAAWAAENRPIAAIMIDIDHFKAVNDKYSHMVGDRVLRTVASLIRASSRPTDLPVRYGGEEFLLELPNSDPDTVANLAERIRRVVESFPWREIKRDLRVTVSIGIAETRHGVGPAEVVRRADDALYAAKRGGRNQVRSYAPRFEDP
jgi:diguanylate cyclase (GGDEF)-like protein